MTKNTGREYEEFVQSIYQAIIQSETLGLTQQQNIIVEIDKKIFDRNNISRQFDIYWEYEHAGHTYRTAIECKDFNSKISIDRIDGFIGKLNDIPGMRGIFASKKGYQSGANIKAKQHNIDLLIVREQNDSDWEDENGNPLLREINLAITALHPARITGFNMLLPKNSEPLDHKVLSEVSNEIVIINEDTGEHYTLKDLQKTLLDEHLNGNGVFEKEFQFKGKIKAPNIEIIILGYKVKYEIPEPSTQNISIDFAEKLLGVVEYLHQGKKSLVFDDHIKKI